MDDKAVLIGELKICSLIEWTFVSESLSWRDCYTVSSAVGAERDVTTTVWLVQSLETSYVSHSISTEIQINKHNAIDISIYSQ